MTNDDAELMAVRLSDHPDYRVLRRLVEMPRLTAMPEGAKKAVVIDIEATGIDVVRDEIMELGMVSFAYTPEGVVLGLLDIYCELRDPGRPISAEVVALTGIDNAMVAGRAIDADEVEAFVADADLVLAHNADYDRRMAERLWPVFATKCWACTMSEIDWKAEGFEGMKLGLLLMQRGVFHEGHRATADCHAAIHLLAGTMPRSGRTGMSLLLERARRTRIRISALGTPYEAKDLLKERGYRWTGQDRLPHKAWQIDMLTEEADAEIAYLRDEVYRGRGQPLCSRVTAFERFSNRC